MQISSLTEREKTPINLQQKRVLSEQSCVSYFSPYYICTRLQVQPPSMAFLYTMYKL